MTRIWPNSLYLAASLVAATLAATLAAQTANDPESRVQRGLAIAPVLLDLQGKNLALVGQGSEHGHGAPTVGDLDRLAGLDPSQQLAGALPQFADARRCHVLTVAHCEGALIGALMDPVSCVSCVSW